MADLSNTPIAVTNNGYSKEEPVPLSSLQTEEAKARQKKAVSVGNPVISLIFFPPAWILLPHITPTRFTIKSEIGRNQSPAGYTKTKIQPRDLFFEHQTSCAILSDGWKLVRANGRQPWELIHLTTDPFETQDLSEQFPLKAKELENKWTRWAEQQHVYPFEYRPWTERINYYQSLYPDQKAKKTKKFP